MFRTYSYFSEILAKIADHLEYTTKARRSSPIDGLSFTMKQIDQVQREDIFGSPTDSFTESFCVWDHFPIHHFRRNKKPIIAIGHEPQKQLVPQKLHHPNYLKKALYYHEILEKGYVQSQTALAEQVGISRTKTRLILRLPKLDKKIKDFILKIDDSDPKLDFLSVYRLQPLLQVKNKERQRREFWQMIEEQYPDQSACEQVAD